MAKSTAAAVVVDHVEGADYIHWQPFGRMVALVRIRGVTRQRGLQLRLRDLEKIWVSSPLLKGATGARRTLPQPP